MRGLFRALNDPTRRAILDMLREDDRTAGEVADAFDMTRPSISHHLDVLRQAGLVSTTREGRFVRYALCATVLEEAVEWMLHLMDEAPDAAPFAPPGSSSPAPDHA